jgi:hypothetical protein
MARSWKILAFQIGCKDLLVAGWSDINSYEAMIEKAKDVLFITRSSSHDWWFPRISFTVLHGWIDTTTAALCSEVQQIPCLIIPDQPRMTKFILGLGATPGILPCSKLYVKHLAPLLQLVTNEATSTHYRQCAQPYAEQICLESSTCSELYCNWILDHVGCFQNQKPPEYIGGMY